MSSWVLILKAIRESDGGLKCAVFLKESGGTECNFLFIQTLRHRLTSIPFFKHYLRPK